MQLYCQASLPLRRRQAREMEPRMLRRPRGRWRRTLCL